MWPMAKETPTTFPSVVVPIEDNLPVEVVLIGQLGAGQGQRLYERSAVMQAQHATFVDEYNEASAKIANADFAHGDPTTVYTFTVGTEDLVFHRHAGHRVIVGVTGNAGAHLRFSGAAPRDALADPRTFVDRMFVVEVPADSVFVLRFSGTVYHQFGSMASGRETAFFAISVHTNEAGGLEGPLLDIVRAGGGNIPLLTEPISEAVARLLMQQDAASSNVQQSRTYRLGPIVDVHNASDNQTVFIVEMEREADAERVVCARAIDITPYGHVTVVPYRPCV